MLYINYKYITMKNIKIYVLIDGINHYEFLSIKDVEKMSHKQIIEAVNKVFKDMQVSNINLIAYQVTNIPNTIVKPLRIILNGKEYYYDRGTNTFYVDTTITEFKLFSELTEEEQKDFPKEFIRIVELTSKN